jgi:hypothetical protein
MNMFRRTVSAVTLATLIGASIPAHAATELMEDELDNRPSAGAAVADALIARPLMLAGTLGGTGLFVASLPFSVISGKVKEAADVLVVKPANATFRRCLGCTTVQDERKHETEMQATQQQ